MKNEILEELWKSKDEVGKEFGYDIDKLVDRLRENQKKEEAKVVNLSKEKKAYT